MENNRGIDVTVKIDVHADPAAGFAYLKNSENDSVWISGIKASKMLTDHPVAAGSRVERTAGLVRRSMDYVTEITSLEESRLLEMKTLSGPFSMAITYTVEPIDAGSRVCLRNQGGPSGLMSLMAPLMAMTVRKHTSKDLAQLKAILES